MTHPLPAAVLWDMDGTLVDTEPYWMAAETPLVEEFGGTWSHEQALRLVGLGLEDSARIFQDSGVRMTVDAIIDRLTSDVMSALSRDGVPFRPGARELLRSLRDAGVKTGLVTMSMRRMADKVVDLMEALRQSAGKSEKPAKRKTKKPAAARKPAAGRRKAG